MDRDEVAGGLPVLVRVPDLRSQAEHRWRTKSLKLIALINTYGGGRGSW